MGGLNKRRGLVTGTEAAEEYFTVYAEVRFLDNTFYEVTEIKKLNFPMMLVLYLGAEW